MAARSGLFTSPSAASGQPSGTGGVPPSV